MNAVALLSTVATGSAALVAIVGGLLVSRVVSLATERSGLLHRRDDLAARLDQAQQRAEEFEERLLDWDADEVVRDHYAELAALPDTPDLATMIRRTGVDRTADEIRPHVDEELERLREARAVLEPLFEDGVPNELFHDLVEAGEIEVPPGEEEPYEEVFDQLVRENTPPKPPRPLGLSLSPAILAPEIQTIRAIRSTQEQAEYAQLARDTEQARHELDALQVQLEQVDLALARVTHPAGVGWGAAVLGYFAAVGTLFPLTLMAASFWRWWLAWLVVGLFATGVAALLIYVVGSVRRLASGS